MHPYKHKATNQLKEKIILDVQQRLLAKFFTQTPAYERKDYYFRVRNKAKANQSVLALVYSPMVRKDRRLYTSCKELYGLYCKTCHEKDVPPLSSWQFKKQMQLLGFVYQRCHRFYGRHKSKVTTAYKNIGIVRHQSRCYEKKHSLATS